MDTMYKKTILLWLKKTIGMLEKVIQMVEKDQYCVDIASQVNASMGLLKSVNSKLLEHHLSSCGPKFLNATQDWKKDLFIKELIRARNVLNK